MAIEAQLNPEFNLGGLPMFGFPPSSSHQDYGGGCGFKFNVLSSGHGRKRQRYGEEQLINMQGQLQTDHRSLCSVSYSHGGVKDIDRKNQNFPVGMDWHSKEIDQYLRLQGEKLKWLMKEQRQQQEAALLRNIELRAQSLLQQKDQEIARASKKTAELQSLLTKLEAESQAWQRLSQEKEALVSSLNNMLEQLTGREEEDAESCCAGDDGIGAGEAGGESRGSECVEKMVCRGCNYRESCVLFLPCRHLCSCKSCHVFLERCPVCGTAKKASIEALIL